MKRWPRLFHVYRVHHKLGLLSFLLLLFFILALGSVLYPLFIRFYFDQVVNELVHRGHGHATVLGEDFSAETLHHVESMEKNAVTTVAVVDSTGRVLIQSRPLADQISGYLQPLGENDHAAYYLSETDWRNHPYLVSKSPVISAGKTAATVVMFMPTDPFRSTVRSFENILLGVILSALLVSAFLIDFWSKRITRPLLNMKQAIGRLAKNQYELSLPVGGNDEIAELNRSIIKLAGELRHYRTERQEFLAEISHELRTPVTYIKGYADILRKGAAKDEDERRKYLLFLYEAADRLNRLMNDLFELVRFDQVGYPLRKARTDLAALLVQICDEMGESFRKSELSLRFEHPEQSLICEIDSERMRQVFVNLLENARKYTPAGGSVRISAQKEQGSVRVEVSDSGMGIPAEELPHIWKHFYRVEKSRSREHGGAGLGLAICKRIVELHGGTVEAQSKPGEGTVFAVDLPRTEIQRSNDF